jgi:alkylated DNA repair dioxygenase AlkB
METEYIELDSFLSDNIANYYLNHLASFTNSPVVWHENLLATDGTMVKIKRKMAYMSDKPDFRYNYATLSFPGQLWTDEMKVLLGLLNQETGRNFNSVLLNWYKDGKDMIGWHSDKEEVLGDINTSVIACINLGATRNFWFRNIETGDKFSYPVSNGDLLMMKSGCQSKYLHAILKEKDITEPRISLTFREVI